MEREDRAAREFMAFDPVQRPEHYNVHPAGIECIDVVEHMSFNIGNAIKYLWRQGLKGDEQTQVQDLEKAIWYINREIGRSQHGTHGE